MLFLVATMSLSFGTYFSSKNINENLIKSFSSQNKSRYLLKVKSNLSRANTVYSFAILLKDENLLVMGDKLLDHTIEDFEKKKESFPDADITLSILGEYKRQLEKIKKDFKKETSLKEAVILLQKMEMIEKKFNHEEEENFGKLLVTNKSLIDSQKNIQMLFKSFHWTLTIILYVLAFVSTRKEKLMRQVQKSEELHRLLISSLAEGVVFCNEKGIVVTCNQSAEEILGQEKKRMVGKHIKEVFKTARSEEGELFDDFHSPFMRAIQVGEVCSNMNIKYGKGGYTQLFLSLSSQPLFKDKNSSHFSTIFSFADITLKVEQQRVIQKQQENLIYSSKMTALGQMAGGIAHEINNPLAIIKAEAEDIIDIADEEGNIDTESAVEAAETITKTSNRIAQIIKGLKIFSRNDSNDKMEVVLIKDIFEDVLALSSDRAKRKGIDFNYKLEDDTFKIKCQPTQLYQVFVNLINNAFDAIENLPQKWVNVDIKREHRQVVIRIIDSGPGIPINEREKIFQPFYTTKEVGKGTGLGLSISKGIIESHRGLFYIDANYTNTCFAIKMPLYDENSEEKDQTEAA